MNIILIGMPGCGKSTVGVLLAKTLIYDFIDTDLLIQANQKKSLCAIIDHEGLERFKTIENDILKKLKTDNTVIATGGSAVYGKEAMEHLKRNGTVVYMKLSSAVIQKRIKNIKTRGIAMTPDCSIEMLSRERAPLYEKYADITIDCEKIKIEQCVDAIIKALNK